MRGTLVTHFVVWLCLRIIPADAGNTASSTTSSGSNWDHPRGCGEHAKARQDYRPLKGSSPRMRGTLLVQAEGADQVGIIPADAGNTGTAALRRI